ncbi:DUF2069 domain-containing protein [Bergeriella denitrificans]|uniref:Membrane protein n=1 Tax=Bergeriella denitrificans TaxID=494 RepID=A0A378UE17_BERDE|nr:DUF2069 domain-containing protein [Bergeriella denitrificans]STZ75410.1 membrane protein [Bergeriella denitrificans]
MTNRFKQHWSYPAACVSLIALIALSLSWELWLAPLRPGGSWLALKALPLCLPLAGILKGKIYTYQYSAMLILIYFAEAFMRLFDADAAGRWCAAAAVLLCVVFFTACVAFAAQHKKAGR